jgi:hypothetical protein
MRKVEFSLRCASLMVLKGWRPSDQPCNGTQNAQEHKSLCLSCFLRAAFAGFSRWLLSLVALAGCSRWLLSLVALAGCSRWLLSLIALLTRNHTAHTCNSYHNAPNALLCHFVPALLPCSCLLSSHRHQTLCGSPELQRPSGLFPSSKSFPLTGSLKPCLSRLVHFHLNMRSPTQWRG